ncbi:gp53-like domain-containing protein [Mixta calida]|uniref:gp53-like domain-containing protein n=1 Tax=Mixta calida TaxID=665913 RepID=UPI0011B08598|nr:hypothetical protein [Mixta calida]
MQDLPSRALPVYQVVASTVFIWRSEYNVGLGEAAKLPAPTAALTGAGWLNIPLSNGAAIMIQWGRFTSLTSGMEVTVDLPVAFPNNIFSAVATHDNSGHFARPTIYSITVLSRTQVKASATMLDAATVGGNVTRGANGSACYGRYILIGN